MKKRIIAVAIFVLMVLFPVIVLKGYQIFIIYSMENNFSEKKDSIAIVWEQYLKSDKGENLCANEILNPLQEHCRNIGSEEIYLWHDGDLYIGMYRYSLFKSIDYICTKSKIREEDIRTDDYKMIPIKGSDNCYIFINGS